MAALAAYVAERDRGTRYVQPFRARERRCRSRSCEVESAPRAGYMAGASFSMLRRTIASWRSLPRWPVRASFPRRRRLFVVAERLDYDSSHDINASSSTSRCLVPPPITIVPTGETARRTGNGGPDDSRRDRSRAGQGFWHLWCSALAVTSAYVGGYWDISWHRSIGRDTFWSRAAHGDLRLRRARRHLIRHT